MPNPKDAESPSPQAPPEAQDDERLSAARLDTPGEQAALPGEPDQLAAWLRRLEMADTVEETVACLNQASTLAPRDPLTRQKTYQFVQELLDRDAHLVYLDEDGDRYHVRSAGQVSFFVPKDRAIPEPRFAARPALLRSAQRWLWLAFFGLLPSGLGAMLFAPLAALSGLALNLKPLPHSSRVLSLFILLLSGGLWLLGLLLGVILLMHLI